jgi:hypothetical protein
VVYCSHSSAAARPMDSNKGPITCPIRL